MNKQRSEVYAFRRSVLHEENTLEIAYDVLVQLIHQTCAEYLVSKSQDNGWRTHELYHFLTEHFPISFDIAKIDNDYASFEEIEEFIEKEVLTALKKKLESEAQLIAAIQEMSSREIDPIIVLQDVLRNMIIKAIDRHWQEHLLMIDNLRAEVALRVVGQKDPLTEFKHEAFHLFDRFSLRLKTELAHALFAFQMVLPQAGDIRDTIERLQAKRKSSTFIN